MTAIDPATPPAAFAAPAPDRPRPPNHRPGRAVVVRGAREVASVRDALAGVRPLTLTDPGDAGKTRLAREVAAAFADDSAG